MIPLSVVNQAHDAGLCVVPPAQNGTKKPLPPGRDPRWRQYQTQRPELTVLKGWYDPSNGLTGLGIVTGRVSGNVEAMDFDTRSGWEAYQEMADHCGIKPLIDRIWAGYGELSPRGAHLIYRCAVIAGNTKLARDAAGKAFIETRGEGGYLVIAPSNGAVHPSGSEYCCVSGSLSTILTISELERKDLWELAKSLDQVKRQPDPTADPLRSSADQSNRPGEDFNLRATWHEVLEPDGWRRLFTRNGVTYWRRPGKDSGVSATTGYAGTDYLYVFTSSTALDNDRAYTKFGAYAILYHRGDFRAATIALGKSGYGEPPKRQTPASPPLRCIPGDPADAKAGGEKQDSPTPQRPPLIALARYIATPRPNSYLVKGVLPAIGMGQIFGDSNVGKSFVAIDLACHLALGIPWRGKKVRQTGVVYVAAEGLAGLQARFYAWCQQVGEVPDRFWIRECPVGLTAAGAAQSLAEDFERLSHPVGMVVLDTFAGNFGVGSENDAADMAAALNGMRDLGQGRFVLNIHHSGHADKMRGRGHSSLLAALDVEFLCARNGEDGPIMLSHTKARDFERMTPLAFRIESVSLPWADEDGEPVNSAMAVPAEPGDTPTKQSPSRKEQQALDLLRRMYQEHERNCAVVGTPRVKLFDWYQGMDFETDKGHKARLRKGLEIKGIIYVDSGYVYLS